MSLLPARTEKIQLKMKALKCSQDSSRYKSMGIFQDAQGQLTLQSMVGSGRISNSSATLWLSSLPAKMKKIRSEMKALEWPQDNMLIFLAVKGRLLRSDWWDLAEIRTHSSFYTCACYLQE